jgi:GTP cyclohydrolase III
MPARVKIVYAARFDPMLMSAPMIIATDHRRRMQSLRKNSGARVRALTMHCTDGPGICGTGPLRDKSAE